jgi:hypothetical protein
MTCNSELALNGWNCTKPCSCSCKNCLNYIKGNYTIKVKKTTYVLKEGSKIIASGNEVDMVNKVNELGL